MLNVYSALLDLQLFSLGGYMEVLEDTSVEEKDWYDVRAEKVNKRDQQDAEYRLRKFFLEEELSLSKELGKDSIRFNSDDRKKLKKRVLDKCFEFYYQRKRVAATLPFLKRLKATSPEKLLDKVSLARELYDFQGFGIDEMLLAPFGEKNSMLTEIGQMLDKYDLNNRIHQRMFVREFRDMAVNWYMATLACTQMVSFFLWDDLKRNYSKYYDFRSFTVLGYGHSDSSLADIPFFRDMPSGYNVSLDVCREKYSLKSRYFAAFLNNTTSDEIKALIENVYSDIRFLLLVTSPDIPRRKYRKIKKIAKDYSGSCIIIPAEQLTHMSDPTKLLSKVFDLIVREDRWYQ